MSSLSDALKRSSNVLKLGASVQVMDYEQRFSSIRSFYEDVLETFMVDKGILEKTLEFATGEWLLSSYIATGMQNVPIFIKADNAGKEIEEYLRTTGKKLGSDSFCPHKQIVLVGFEPDLRVCLNGWTIITHHMDNGCRRMLENLLNEP